MSAGRIGIIGAGASGIGVARALRKDGLDFEVIEATKDVGGNWQPDGPASKMYRSAHLISSKKNTQFSDHPMPDDYPHYPHNSLMFKYLNDVVDAADVRKAIRFGAGVLHAAPEDGGWRVTLSDGEEAFYDALVVCAGLLRKPFAPVYPGRFDGETMHAADYRSSAALEGRRVLVVGGGNSGCDIAVDAAHVAAKVFHSTRRGYHYMPKFIAGKPTQEWLMDISPQFRGADEYWSHVADVFKLAGFDGRDFGLPEPDHSIQAAHPIMNSQILYHIGHGAIAPAPDVARLDGGVVEFVDGRRERIDVIVWATGYGVDLPFLSGAGFDAKADLGGAFLKVLSGRYDNLIYVGYLNTPSGIGNIANIVGKFVSKYLISKNEKSPGWIRLKSIQSSGAQIDLGQDRFMKTSRHSHEVDLWKFIKTINFISSELSK
ncbi:flavin-binding monooxygenase [Methylopila jiangsuensis]|uniref:Trimethylamine monooxygenase n=1 Tax=Methylopila jiangsuensis TaxID=586230 RepID=A0A9W6JFX1_9HYPH|nr:NAD(P)-binding domain-containing protein [Methylopila jiangsuensis]MDR6286806.1 cation diffusion facilitator CzcD-associated flavoprotein CzcO [Methylopila jiangsuensis]GLK76846.1 flavin-binding monooxygenase [Methylopila jiangsuensis]